VNKFEEALKAFDLGEVQVSWAEILIANNKRDEAAAHYEKACAAQVLDKNGCIEHAYNLWRRGEAPDVVLAPCWRALQAKPADTALLTAMGALEENLKHQAHAEADYRAAMLLSTTKARETPPHRALYDLLMHMKRTQEAKELGRPEEEIY
jgi:hypothetical protein